MTSPQGGGSVQMPLTVLDLPTMVEAYRTIDGKSGDYVKTADVSQVRERQAWARDRDAGGPGGRVRAAWAWPRARSSFLWSPVLSPCLALTPCSRAVTCCQIMVVHEDDDEAQALRSRRPTGRSTPPNAALTVNCPRRSARHVRDAAEARDALEMMRARACTRASRMGILETRVWR